MRIPIPQALQNILSARYGKDVRQSIYDAIESINEVAEESKETAITSKDSAAASALQAANAASSATGSVNAVNTSAVNAANSATAASTSATNATNSAKAAKTSETNANTSANAAKAFADNALQSEILAEGYRDEVLGQINNAKTHADNAKKSADDAATSLAGVAQYNDIAKSYAVGGTGTRTGEDTDNAAYYYQEVRTLANGVKGGLVPAGSITFAELASKELIVGRLFDITDEFTTDSRFRIPGVLKPAGTDVYVDADGKLNCLTGSQVLGIKGSAESTYRVGKVNITAANIGLGNVGNFKAVSTVANQSLTSTEKDNARKNIGINLDYINEQIEEINTNANDAWDMARTLEEFIGGSKYLSDYGDDVVDAIVNIGQRLDAIDVDLNSKTY